MGDTILTEERARKDDEQEFRGDWEHLRAQTKDPKQGDPFGGGHGKQANLEGASSGQEKHVGQGGFGARMVGASGEAVQAHADEWGQLATPVQAVDGPLDGGMAAQRASIERNTGSDWYDGDPHWLKEEKAYSREWATENLATLDRHKFEQWRWCGAYNTWTPLANAGHHAMAELVESAGLMGFNTGEARDSAGFVEGLEASLDMAINLVDAKVLDHGKTSWATRGDSNTAVSKAKPELKGEQLGPKLGSVTDAYNEVKLAHHGIYQGLLKDRQAALAAEGGKYTAEIGEINEVIEFWSGMGEMVGGKMPAVKKVVTGQTGAALDKRFGNNGDAHAKKELKAAKNAAYKADQNQHDYQSDIDAHAHADNYEEHHDNWGKGGEENLKKMEEEGEYTPPEVGEAELPELSVGGMLKTGLTLYYADKLEALQKKLEGVRGMEKATGRTIDFVATKAAQEAMKKAVGHLEEEMKKLNDDSLRDREQDFVSFGRDLDAYAVEHKDELQKLHSGELVPGMNGEIYGTALACVAKVEKYRQISKLALATFPFNEFNSEVTHMGRERIGAERPAESATRSYDHAYRPPPSLPDMSADEQAAYQQIAGSYLLLLKLDARWGVRLEGVSSKFQTLMKKVSGQNSKAEVGKKF